MTESIYARENCPFCGSLDVDGTGSADFVHCNACGAFGPNGHENWNKRAIPLRVNKVLEVWLHQQVFMSENAPLYSAPYDAIGDFINELREAYEKY